MGDITAGTSPVIPLGLGLLAFTAALFALASRDQRSPYLTNAAYAPSLAVLVAIAATFAAAQVPRASIWWQLVLELIAAASMLTGIYLLARATIVLRNRRVNFRDDFERLSNFTLFRRVKTWRHNLKGKPNYTHNPLPWPEALMAKLATIEPQLEAALSRHAALETTDSPTVSMTLHCESIVSADLKLIPLALSFLESECLVQYMTCARHPIGFVAALRREAKKQGLWDSKRGQIVLVDAYSPHFGFTDSVHAVKTEQIKKWGVEVIPSGPSYAGMHTASAKAFNIAKTTSEKIHGNVPKRWPTLVIYEGAAGLADLESPEQYRVFVRHVMPSEQLWGGMLTVFAELQPSVDDQRVLRAYSDLYVDLTTKAQ